RLGLAASGRPLSKYRALISGLIDRDKIDALAVGRPDRGGIRSSKGQACEGTPPKVVDPHITAAARSLEQRDPRAVRRETRIVVLSSGQINCLHIAAPIHPD